MVDKKLISQTTNTEQVPLSGTTASAATLKSSGMMTGTQPGYMGQSTLGTTAATVVQEKPIVEQVVERTFVEKRNEGKTLEIHEQPIVEIHQKPIIENITAPAEIRKQTLPTRFEEVNQAQGFVMPEKPTQIKHTKETFVAQGAAAISQPLIETRSSTQIIEQPVVTQIVNKPIVEVTEANVQKVVHEKPIVKVVREAPLTMQGTALGATGKALNVTTTESVIQETGRTKEFEKGGAFMGPSTHLGNQGLGTGPTTQASTFGSGMTFQPGLTTQASGSGLASTGLGTGMTSSNLQSGISPGMPSSNLQGSNLPSGTHLGTFVEKEVISNKKETKF